MALLTLGDEVEESPKPAASSQMGKDAASVAPEGFSLLTQDDQGFSLPIPEEWIDQTSLLRPSTPLVEFAAAPLSSSKEANPAMTVTVLVGPVPYDFTAQDFLKVGEGQRSTTGELTSLPAGDFAHLVWREQRMARHVWALPHRGRMYSIIFDFVDTTDDSTTMQTMMGGFRLMPDATLRPDECARVLRSFTDSGADSLDALLLSVPEACGSFGVFRETALNELGAQPAESLYQTMTRSCEYAGASVGISDTQLCKDLSAKSE